MNMKGIVACFVILGVWISIVVFFNSGYHATKTGLIYSTIDKIVSKNNELLQWICQPFCQPFCVTASVKSGSYHDTQVVNLKTTLPVSAIYFTLDGTEPTVDGKYQNSIKVYGTETLTFVAVNLLTGAKSTIASERYLLPSMIQRMIIDNEKHDPILTREIRNEINKLDSVVLRRLFTQNIRIKLVNCFTDEPKLRDYSIPKETMALYYAQTIYAHINEYQFDGLVSTYIHELGHAYDYNFKIGGKMLSEQPEFQEIWHAESLILFPNVDYYNSCSIETFAQSFALYYYSEMTKEYLKSKAPQIFAFLEIVTV